MFSSVRRLLGWLWPSRPVLEVGENLWHETLAELRVRGCVGRRESGAFLLAAQSGESRRVVRAVFFDDLDPDCLVGDIQFRNPLGYSRLWDVCEDENLRVVADVHTHPGRRVTQSNLDRQNPMIAAIGHIALIVPQYATRPVRARDVGVHEYRGEDGWRTSLGRDAARALKIRSDR